MPVPAYLRSPYLWLSYALAVVAAAAAVLARRPLDPVLCDRYAYLLATLAVMISATVGGVGPGLLCTALVGALDMYLWIEPRSTLFQFGHTVDVAGFILFLTVGTGLSLISGLFHYARRREREAYARQAAAEQAQRILSSITECYLAVDREWCFTQINPQAAAYFGKPADEMIGQNVWEIAPLLRGSALEHRMRQVMTDRQPIHMELPSRLNPGRWIELHAYPTERGLEVYFRDISDRKQAEEALHRSEARLQALIEHLPFDFWTIDARSGRYVMINSVCREHWGDLRGLRPADLGVPPDILACWQDNNRRVLAGEVVRNEATYLIRGEPRTVVEILAPIRDGSEIQGLVGVNVDITERKRIEEQLRQREADLADAQALAHLGSYRVELPADRTTWSAETFRICGRDPALGAPSIAEFIGTIHPDDRAHFQQVAGAAASRVMSYEMEYRIVRPDGSIRYLHSIGRSFPGPTGEVAGLFGTVLDITDRKLTEEALQRAKQQAEAASQAKDQFLATLSHELRTPLTPVLATVPLLESNPHLDAEGRDDLQMIRRNVELEARLIDDLLDLTRIVRGKLELRPQLLDATVVLQYALQTCWPDIQAKGLHVSTDWVPHQYWVQADPARLQQVFWNLIKNAVKFTPDGGCIDIRCYRSPQQQIVFEVTDSGMGIDPDLLPRLFNAFEQGSRAVTRQFGGLGLGLAISRAIVEQHGGSIAAESAGRGRGATFRVQLPAAAPPPDNQAGPPAAARLAVACPSPPPRGRILLVEDHADTAAILSQLLRRQGYAVQTAGTLQAALQLGQQQRFDLLISDLGLPDGNGLDLLDQLRQRGQTLPAIALSGYGMDEDIRRSKEAGFAAHLVKPIDLTQLRAAIDSLVALGPSVPAEPGIPALESIPRSAENQV